MVEFKGAIYGKIAKMPKNSKASDSFVQLENIKINKDKLWYFLIEKEQQVTDNIIQEIQIIKYNKKNDKNLGLLIYEMKKYFEHTELKEYFTVLQLENDKCNKYVIIKNIPDVFVGDRKFISILCENLIKLLQ